MSSHASKEIRAASAAPEAKRLRPFGGLIEGIRRRRDLSEALSLLRRAAAENNSGLLSQAVSHLEGMGAPLAAKAIRKAGKMLLEYPSPFTSDSSSSAVSSIAAFIMAASKELPKDESGEKDTSTCGKTVSLLKDIAASRENSWAGTPANSYALLSCADALWELEYGNFKFWEGMLLEPATQQFMITKLLEMEPTENPREHGWYALKKNIAPIASAIALNPSQKKFDFLVSALSDSDKRTVRAAVASVICLEAVPEPLESAVQAALRPADMAQTAHLLAYTRKLRRLTEQKSPERPRVVRDLAALHHGGLEFLRPVLEKAGASLASDALSFDYQKVHAPNSFEADCLDALGSLAATGIAPYSHKTLSKILSASLHTAWAGGPAHWLASAIISKSGNESLKDVAYSLQTGRIRKCGEALQYADDRQFAAAVELMNIHASGRNDALPLLMEAGQDMLEIFNDPPGNTDEERRSWQMKASYVLNQLARGGMGMPGFEAANDDKEASG